MKHSMDEVAEIQRAFEASFARNPGVVGVGIGMNRRQDDLALNVYVSGEEVADSLPKSFSGVDVVCDVVGEFKAL